MKSSSTRQQKEIREAREKRIQLLREKAAREYRERMDEMQKAIEAARNPIAVEIASIVEPLFTKIVRVSGGACKPNANDGIIHVPVTKQNPRGYDSASPLGCCRAWFNIDIEHDFELCRLNVRKPIPPQIVAHIRKLVAHFDAIAARIERIQDTTDYQAIRDLTPRKAGGK